MAEQTPHQNTTFEVDGGTAHGYLAVPSSGSGPGVIVIQEWWGLTDHIKDVADRLAAEGFVALAPDLYGGWITHDGDEAGEMMSQLPAEDGAAALAGATQFLLDNPAVSSETIGTIGFCMGGGFVLALAAQQGSTISAAIPFYGVGQGVPRSYAGIQGAVQGHYGKHDEMYPVEKAEETERQLQQETGAEVQFYYYDAGHAFHNDENLLGTYDAELAKLAWDRSVSFLREKVA